VEVDEDGERADERRIAEPVLAVETQAGERILVDLDEAATARVGRRVEEQRRVHEHLAHERDAAEQLAVASRDGGAPRRGHDTDLATGRHLAVDARVSGGHVLGYVAVQRADEAAEGFERLVETPVRTPLATLGRRVCATHEKAVVPAPEIVQAFDEAVQVLPLRRQTGVHA